MLQSGGLSDCCSMRFFMSRLKAHFSKVLGFKNAEQFVSRPESWGSVGHQCVTQR